METLYDLFLSGFVENADKPAVIWYNVINQSTVTYKELLLQSELVSACLKEVRATMGFVGIFMEQDICFPALVLGILHNRMAFTCMDTNAPEKQIFSLLQTLNVHWVFTSKHNAKPFKRTDLLSKYGMIKIEIKIHDIDIALWQLQDFESCKTLKSKGMAYAIQTSGTTGIPKIVRVPHRCIVVNIHHLSEILKIKVDDIIFLGTPLTFDPSVVELFLALGCGAALFIVPSEVRASPTLLLEALFPRKPHVISGVTVLQATPSVVSRWSLQELQERVLAINTTLKVLLLGGEPCPDGVTLSKWRGSHNQTQMFNVYGITEVSCWASIHRIEECSQINATSIEKYTPQTHSVPLGSPLAQTLLEVRDHLGYKIIHGEGEMFIGSMERICIIDDEVEDNVFPPVFRATGDIVQVDSQTGQLLFLGRRDSVVKRWGHRVSLTQVEHVVASHPTVDRCCCVWDPSKAWLGLAIITRDQQSNDTCVRSLRQFLSSRLATGALPDLITAVETLPLTSHGKIDREKVRSLLKAKDIKINILSTPLAIAFARLWLKYLGSEPKPEDTFLQFGGNSFLALRLTTELEETWGYRIAGAFISLLLMGSNFRQCCNYLDSEPSEGNTLTSELYDDVKMDSNAVNLEGAIQIPSASKLSALKENKDLEWHKNTSDYLSVENEVTVKEAQSKRKFEIAYKKESEILGMGDSLNGADSATNGKHVKRVKCTSSDMNIGANTTNVRVTDMDRHVNVTNHSICLSEDEKTCVEDTLLCTSCRGQITKFGAAEEQHGYEHLKLTTRNVDLALDWKFNLGKCVDASPCYIKFSSGKTLVVIGSHSHRVAILDGSTGTPVAECELGDRVESSACISPCGKFGVIGCYDGGVYCINLTSGALLWRYQTSGMVKSSPVLCLKGSAIIVGSYDSKLYCIRIQDGLLVWSITPGGGSIFASPCLSVATSTVYVGTLNGTCAAICEGTGQMKWRTKFESPIFASPVPTHAAMAVLFTEVVGNVHCLSVSSGERLWTFKAEGNIFSSFCTQLISNGSETYELYVFGCHDKSVYCLRWTQHCDNVVLQWRLNVDSAVFATPFVFPVSESALDTRGDGLWAAIVTTRGTVLLVNADTGLVKCSFPLPHEVFSSPVACDSRLVVGCRDNFVYSLSIVS